MSQNWPPLIHPEKLIELNPADFTLIDARAEINAEEKYKSGYLKGALYIDLNLDLATVDGHPEKGGRHPLPSVEKFSDALSKLGISRTSHVIIYDDTYGANAAARCWWMLKSVGHQKVQVLNGGFQSALKLGFPLSSEKESTTAAEKYPVSNWLLPLATMEDVDKARKNNKQMVIDVRAKDRFNGITEPLDLIAGHIPGALNVPFSENLDENGFYQSPEKLKEKYTKILGTTEPENTIVHCGSGVTACHTLLAMHYAGISIPKLYVGSWSEWSRNELPITTRQNNFL